MPTIPVNEEIFELVLESLRNGITIKQLADNMAELSVDFPSAAMMYKYALSDSDKRLAYTLAREYYSNTIADDIISIADTVKDPSRARNMIDARKWHASKINPKIYGDKLDLNVEGKIDIGAAVNAGRARLASMRKQELLDITPVQVEEIDPFS